MSFLALMLAEVGRLRYRPRAGLAAIAALLLGLLGPPIWMWSATPVTADEYAAAAAEYELIRDSCDCTIESLLREPDTFHEVILMGLGPWLLLVAVFVMFLMIVYAAADFASGAITTQLTFTPSRARLLAARTLVAGAFGAFLMAVSGIAAATVCIVWFVAANGYASLPPDYAMLRTLVGAILLGAIVSVLSTLLVFLFQGGFVSGTLVTTVLLGTLLIEAMAYDVPLPHWLFQLLPPRQGEALVIGFADPQYEQAPLNAAEALTAPGAIGYFVVLIALIGVHAVVVFQRRDIKN